MKNPREPTYIRAMDFNRVQLCKCIGRQTGSNLNLSTHYLCTHVYQIFPGNGYSQDSQKLRSDSRAPTCPNCFLIRFVLSHVGSGFLRFARFALSRSDSSVAGSCWLLVVGLVRDGSYLLRVCLSHLMPLDFCVSPPFSGCVSCYTCLPRGGAWNQ